MRTSASFERLIGRVALLTALVTSPATAGTIRGVLWLKAPVGISRKSSTAGRAQVARIQRGVTDAVLYVEDVPDAIEARLAHPTTGSWWSRKPVQSRIQTNLPFAPLVTAVAVGTRVEFHNHDRVFHNVFSISSAKPLELGAVAPGGTAGVRFDRTGVVNLFCNLHSDETGYVVVTPNHVFARPDSLGAFRLPKLPPGVYVLHVWHPKGGELQRSVRVPRRGDVDLDLRLQ